MRNSTNILASLLVVCLLAGTVSAAASMQWVPVTGPTVGTGSVPSGYSCYDLMVTVDANIGVMEIYAQAETPAAGDFYQDANGGDTKVADAFITVFPSLEFDSYVTMPVSYGILGAAVDLTPINPRALTFDDQLLDMAWGASGGAESGAGTFHTARLTVKNGRLIDYDVYVNTFVSGDDPLVYTFSGTIPESATLGLLLLGGLIVLRRRSFDFPRERATG